MTRPTAVAPQMRSNWYGWQTLMVDGAWVASFLVASKSDTGGALIGFGCLDYFFGAPIVHWAHGNVGTGFGSLGLRALPMVAGAGILLSGRNGGNGDGSGDIGNALMALTVMGVGVVAAVTIDAAVLAREDVPVTPIPDTTALGVPLYRIAPSSTLTRNGGTLGVSGAF